MCVHACTCSLCPCVTCACTPVRCERACEHSRVHCVQVCVCTCKSWCVCMICMGVHVHTCGHACVHVCTCVCTCVYMGGHVGMGDLLITAPPGLSGHVWLCSRCFSWALVTLDVRLQSCFGASCWVEGIPGLG